MGACLSVQSFRSSSNRQRHGGVGGADDTNGQDNKRPDAASPTAAGVTFAPSANNPSQRVAPAASSPVATSSSAPAPHGGYHGRSQSSVDAHHVQGMATSGPSGPDPSWPPAPPLSVSDMALQPKQGGKQQGGGGGGSGGSGGGNNLVMPAGGPGSNLVAYSMEELRRATGDFRRKLGEGGFGSVYKGVFDAQLCRKMEGVLGGMGRPSSLEVAVKVLNEEGLQGHKEWMAEVTVLGSLRHKHLVRLLGWAAEGNSRLLVYEFVHNGSLETLLHMTPPDLEPPPWGLRMRIALGVAKCLAYLHEETSRPIIYRDVKSANVLLDKDWTPKLADFGLAKDGPVGDKTHVTTQVVGTHGYADPDYIITGHLTPKSDVYGFGVLLIELMTGRPAVWGAEDGYTGALNYTGASQLTGDEEEEEFDLAEWADPFLQDKKRVREILDPRLDQASVPLRGLQRAATLAHNCVNENPYERPQMSSVVKTLLSVQQPGFEWQGRMYGTPGVGEAGGGGR